MPVYSYKCFKCGEKFEFHDTNYDEVMDEADCPKCGSSESVLVYSPPSTRGRAGEFCSKSAGWRYT